jgi:hypothetical protein
MSRPFEPEEQCGLSGGRFSHTGLEHIAIETKTQLFFSGGCLVGLHFSNNRMVKFRTRISRRIAVCFINTLPYIKYTHAIISFAELHIGVNIPRSLRTSDRI